MKHKCKVWIAMAIFFISSTSVTHAANPGFNEQEAKNLFTSYVTPMINIGLWAVPLSTVLAVLVLAIKYMMKDEDEREQKPFTKHIKAILVVAIIAESIQIILRIFGLA
ncbi:MAG: hypothetical protein RR788_04155 [Erysipelotrichaceae bacterium]